jgi:hypothetical protein
MHVCMCPTYLPPRDQRLKAARTMSQESQASREQRDETIIT